MSFKFVPWRDFIAYRDRDADEDFLRMVARESKAAFIKGMKDAKSGRHYSGKPRQSSAAGEYPAIQSGALMASIRTRVDAHSVSIRTDKFYGNYLASGTSKMAPRQMSKEALIEGLENANRISPWAYWKAD